MRRIPAIVATLGLAVVCVAQPNDTPTARPSRADAPGVHLALRPASGTTSVLGPTSWRALNIAIHALPTFHRRWARWVVGGPDGWWSTTNWYTRVIYIHRNVPKSKLYSVAAHEWGHILQARAYDGRVNTMIRALRRYYGGSGVMGAEYAADCMAKLQGATWTHYTSCHNRHWRRGARRLLRGEHV